MRHSADGFRFPVAWDGSLVLRKRAVASCLQACEQRFEVHQPSGRLLLLIILNGYFRSNNGKHRQLIFQAHERLRLLQVYEEGRPSLGTHRLFGNGEDDGRRPTRLSSSGSGVSSRSPSRRRGRRRGTPSRRATRARCRCSSHTPFARAAGCATVRRGRGVAQADRDACWRCAAVSCRRCARHTAREALFPLAYVCMPLLPLTK